MNATTGDSASNHSIRLAERQQVLRELHNSTSQLLVALQLQLGHVRNCCDSNTEPLFEKIAETLQSIHTSIKQIEMQPRDDWGLEQHHVQTARVFLSLASGT